MIINPAMVKAISASGSQRSGYDPKVSRGKEPIKAEEHWSQLAITWRSLSHNRSWSRGVLIETLPYQP